MVVRQEDLAADPSTKFPDLFTRLHLSFTDRTERFIALSTSELNPIEAPNGRLHHTRRNSGRSLDVWERRLPAEDIARVRHLTEDVADRFYTTSSWPTSSAAISSETMRS
jgi:hypothetical protein